MAVQGGLCNSYWLCTACTIDGANHCKIVGACIKKVSTMLEFAPSYWKLKYRCTLSEITLPFNVNSCTLPSKQTSHLPICFWIAKNLPGCVTFHPKVSQPKHFGFFLPLSFAFSKQSQSRRFSFSSCFMASGTTKAKTFLWQKKISWKKERTLCWVELVKHIFIIEKCQSVAAFSELNEFLSQTKLN